MDLLSSPNEFSLLEHSELLVCHFYPEAWQPGCEQHFNVQLPEGLAERAVDKRLTEFVAGRFLAHSLLLKQHCKQPLLRDERTRAPIWPSGFVGAISHSKGVAACAVHANKHTGIKGVGIDVEHWTPQRTADSIAKEVWDDTEATLAQTAQWRDSNEQPWTREQALTLVFSAKEAIYKALYPQVRAYFGFASAKLTAIEGTHTKGQLHFELATALTPSLPKYYPLSVEYHCERNWVITGLEVD